MAAVLLNSPTLSRASRIGIQKLSSALTSKFIDFYFLDLTMKNFPTLRDWIDDLAENDLLTIAKPGLSLNFELAALAHRLDGERATFFPNPGGIHGIPVVSGIMSNRPWIARATGC
jgi:hypothetical protein